MQNSNGSVRPKQISEKDEKVLKNQIQKLSISEKYSVYYSTAMKQSKLGLFDNKRLIVLNEKQRTFMYISKLPEYLLPLYTQDQVKSLKPKGLIARSDVVKGNILDFKCRQPPGKLSTFQIMYKQAGQTISWIFQVGNTKMMNQWIQLIRQSLTKDHPIQNIQNKRVDQPKINPFQNNINNQSKVSQNNNIPIKNNYTYANNSNTINIPQNQKNSNSQPQSRLIQDYQLSKIKNQPLQKSKIDPLVSSKIDPKPNESKIQQQKNKQPYRIQQPKKNQPIQINYTLQPKRDYPSKYSNEQIGDPAIQIKKLRKDHPSKFNLDNQLSRKNLHENNQIEPNIAQQQPKFQRSSFNKKLNYAQESPKSRFGQQPRQGIIYQSRKNINSRDRISRQNYKQPQNLHNQVLLQQPDLKKQRSLADSGKIYNSKQKLKKFNQQSQQFISNSSQQDKPPLKFKSQFKPDWKQRLNIVQNNNNNDRITFGTGMKDQSMKSIKPNKKNNKSWNQRFAEERNKLQVYQSFVETSYNIVREIINQLPLEPDQRQYFPIKSQPPYFIYCIQGLIFNLHIFIDGPSIASNNSSTDLALLYQQESYSQLRRQFYNYNLILAATNNQGFVKIPLCALYQYRGLLITCKADVPQDFQGVTPQHYQRHFASIEQKINLSFPIGNFQAFIHPQNKYLLLDDLHSLIPHLPNPYLGYFRKQSILMLSQQIESSQDIFDAHAKLIEYKLPQFIQKIQSIQSYIVNNKDLKRQLHELGLSMSHLSIVIKQSNSQYLKKIMMTQAVAIIFQQVFRSQISRLILAIPAQKLTAVGADKIFMDGCHALLQLMFDYTNQGQALWRLIVEQIRKRFNIIVAKEDIIGGYLLASVTQRIGLVCDYKQSSFDRHNTDFFVSTGNIPKDLLKGFKIKVRRYDLQDLSEDVKQIKDIIRSPPQQQKFKRLFQILRLNQQSIPSYLQEYQQQILAYICNFVPFGSQRYHHLGLYSALIQQPHSYFGTKVCLLALKWCVKQKMQQQLHRIFQIKEQQNAFWLGQNNPVIGQYYDFFATFYATSGKYQESIKLAKMSLKNISKIIGNGEPAVADRHYQLGNIFFKMGKKEQAIRQYSRTRDILVAHQQTHIRQFSLILLKIALLYLNFGKIQQAMAEANKALSFFQNDQETQTQQANAFQIMHRCFQILKKWQQLQQLASDISHRFNLTENISIFQRMLKMCLLPKFRTLSSIQIKHLQSILSKLQYQNVNQDQMKAFNYLNRKAKNGNIIAKIVSLLDNINNIYQQITRKDTFRLFKSYDLSPKSQAQQLLIIFDAVATLVGYPFLIGGLSDPTI